MEKDSMFNWFATYKLIYIQIFYSFYFIFFSKNGSSVALFNRNSLTEFKLKIEQ